MSARFGPPLIGSYLNTMLFTLELVAAYVYFFANPRSLKDSIFLKCCVVTSLVSDTVGTIGVCAQIFVITMAFTDVVTPGKLYWAFQMYIASNMTSAFIFQSYMLHRYWKLSQNIIVTFLVAVLIIASLGTTMGLLVQNWAIVTNELFQQSSTHMYELWIILVLATAMLTDISITIALLWQMKRSPRYNRASRRTRRLLKNISSQAIRTGVVPCIFALITLVTYVAYKNQSHATCFGYMLGRVYTTTMLYSLIYRDKLYPDGGNGETLPSTFETGPTFATASLQGGSTFPTVPAIEKWTSPDSISGAKCDSTNSQEMGSDHTLNEQSSPDTPTSQTPRFGPPEKTTLSFSEFGVVEL